MCKVLIKDTKENINFIIYNVIFSKKKIFTEDEVLKEINNLYDLNLTLDDIKKEFSFYVQVGLITEHINGYSVNN